LNNSYIWYKVKYISGDRFLWVPSYNIRISDTDSSIGNSPAIGSGYINLVSLESYPVRSGPGTEYEIAGNIQNNTKVEIFATYMPKNNKENNSGSTAKQEEWYAINDGTFDQPVWILGSFIRLGE